MSNAAQLRHDLALSLYDNLLPPTELWNFQWSVYPSPPAQVAAPAVVIAPRAPYRRRVDYRREEVRLQLTVLFPQVTGKDGLELLDNAVQIVLAAVEALDMVTWESVDSVGPTVDVGGLTYIAATIGVVAYLEGDS